MDLGAVRTPVPIDVAELGQFLGNLTQAAPLARFGRCPGKPSSFSNDLGSKLSV
jgi:hypothetical protein